MNSLSLWKGKDAKKTQGRKEDAKTREGLREIGLDWHIREIAYKKEAL